MTTPTTTRGSAWSVTINNPTDDDEECINRARQKGWKVEGQKEMGSEGTPHYQLVVKTPQVRFSAMKTAFPRAHIEIARNVAALETYVKKEDTRIGELAETSELYPSLSKLWTLVYHDYKEGANLTTPTQHLKYFDERIRELIVQGYNVETMGVNPQMRSAVKLYGNAIFQRSTNLLNRALVADRQTDRQTESDLESIISL